YLSCPASLIFLHPLLTSYLYTLSLHDALPIFLIPVPLPLSSRSILSLYRGLGFYHIRMHLGFDPFGHIGFPRNALKARRLSQSIDRKSTRLNSSHVKTSYAVFCLKKKK